MHTSHTRSAPQVQQSTLATHAQPPQVQQSTLATHAQPPQVQQSTLATHAQPPQVQQSTLATHAQPSQSTPLFKRPHAIVPIYQAARSHCANGKVSLFRQQCLIVQAAMSHHSSSKISLFRQHRYSSGNTPNATLIVSQACDASCNKACH